MNIGQRRCHYCGLEESSWKRANGYFCSFGCMIRFIVSPRIIKALVAFIVIFFLLTFLSFIRYVAESNLHF
ncbi:MAG: hypothetical protein ACFFB5_15425 [Promethearchaeota archaeon]